MLYPVERLPGIAIDHTVPASDEWIHPPGSLLAEVFGGWRLPAVAGRVEPGGSLEFDKLWRIAQARSGDLDPSEPTAGPAGEPDGPAMHEPDLIHPSAEQLRAFSRYQLDDGEHRTSCGSRGDRHRRRAR